MPRKEDEAADQHQRRPADGPADGRTCIDAAPGLRGRSSGLSRVGVGGRIYRAGTGGDVCRGYHVGNDLSVVVGRDDLSRRDDRLRLRRYPAAGVSIRTAGERCSLRTEFPSEQVIVVYFFFEKGEMQKEEAACQHTGQHRRNIALGDSMCPRSKSQSFRHHSRSPRRREACSSIGRRRRHSNSRSLQRSRYA